jgi:hypothetical protein
MQSTQLVYFGIVLLLLVIGILIFVPKWQVNQSITEQLHDSRPRGFELEKEKLKLEDEARKTLAQIIGGLLVFVGLIITYNTYQIGVQKQDLDREGQFTDRFSKAVTHLGDDKLAVRIGGIFELERIANDSPKDRLSVKQVLYTYLHTNFRTPIDRASYEVPEKRHNSNGLTLYDYTADSELQTILNVMQRLMDDNERLDMRKLDLTNKSLARANYKIANFSFSMLPGTIFFGSDFTNARFNGAVLDRGTTDIREWEEIGRSLVKLVVPTEVRANFTDADFSGASLFETDFAEAVMKGAKFRKANIKGTFFRSADLSYAQFNGASGNASFVGSNLTQTNFADSVLVGAQFKNATISLTNFSGANLLEAKGLTHETMGEAIIDEKTVLPKELVPYRDELLKVSKVNAKRLMGEIQTEMFEKIVP